MNEPEQHCSDSGEHVPCTPLKISDGLKPDRIEVSLTESKSSRAYRNRRAPDRIRAAAERRQNPNRNGERFNYFIRSNVPVALLFELITGAKNREGDTELGGVVAPNM